MDVARAGFTDFPRSAVVGRGFRPAIFTGSVNYRNIRRKETSLSQVTEALNLLGQATSRPAAPVRLESGSDPQLEIAWGSFHQGIGRNLATVLSWTRVPRNFLDGSFFKECWVERKIPRRAVLAAALWHIVFLVMPSPRLPAARTHYSAFENTELSWSGHISDFPLKESKAPKAKPSPRGEPQKPLPPEGADAFHPRQHILSDPVHPNHPRQTLVNSAAPLEPPKILPNLPNVVQFQQLAAPARPRLEISKETLAKLRPRQVRKVALTTSPAPDLPTLDQKLADIAPALLPPTTSAPARPKLELNTGAAPRLTPRNQQVEAEPAPEVSSGTPNGNAASTLIALSATPGPPAPVVPPQGNLAARVSISPEGKQPGVPGGSPNGTAGANGGSRGNPTSGGGTAGGNGTGKTGMDISITGGNPTANDGLSALGGSGKPVSAAPRGLILKPDAHVKPDDTPAPSGPPNFAALAPGAQPERIFASRKIYKLQVNMPNLNSATGSWILNFSEMRTDSAASHAPSTVAGPEPLRKVDPKYPPTLIKDHVEGEVVLYAVIRRDGSVDSIQLVRGLDEQLDANAMNALSQWKFRPATREGAPVELEAIIHIPFHAPPDR